jgi:putative Mg2+ transporter-C (MgtC) family protein
VNPLGFDDVLLRLGAAVVSGAIIGLDREIKDKPVGLRTMALVSLGSAVFLLTSLGHATPDSTTRVIQGIVTGIGFLGAGTIMRGQSEQSVSGLTTAASIWLASAVGIACGMAFWPLVIISCAFGLAILLLEPFERWLKSLLS